MLKRLCRLALIRKDDEAVTLIELLAVIVILAIIASIAIPVVSGSINSAKANSTEQDLNIISEALNRYMQDPSNNGQYPTTAATTSGTSSTKTITTWVPLSSVTNIGNYVTVTNDGWGQPLYYFSPDGKSFEVATAAAANQNPTNSDGSYYITSSTSVQDGNVPTP